MKKIFINNIKITKNKIRLLLILALTLLLLIIYLFVNAFWKDNAYHETMINGELIMQLPSSFKIIEISNETSANLASDENRYESPDKKFKFYYPAFWTLKQQDFPGSEILYHVDLLSEKPAIHGYVEVWSINETLPEFLSKAKTSLSPSVYDLRESNESIGLTSSIKWTYNVKTTTDNIHAEQIFFKKDDKIYIVSIYAPVAEWNEKYENSLKTIASSLRLLS